MALTAGSKNTNLLKSMNTYVFNNLITADGLDVHFPGTREVFEPSGATWVQVHYLLGLSRLFQSVTDSGSAEGNLVSGVINLNCCEFVDRRIGVSYALSTLRDTVRARFTEGIAIPVLDYDTVGNPLGGYLNVTSINENEVRDGFSPEDNGISIWNISVSLQYVESFS
jgi:hypothetical protein